MRPTVLLFDVDGTLVTTGGAGRRAIERAFEAFTGRRDATEGLVFGGMTDRAIVRYGLARLGLEEREETIDRFLDAYVAHLEEEVRLAEGYAALPGVTGLLARLADREGLAVGLGTGNIRRGAEVKLARVGLGEAFAFGGFGCDSEDRPTLIRRGAERGAAHLGVALEACRVVVIGDTPRDVAAARANGAECLATATGGATREALAEVAPTALVPDLSDPSTFDFLVG